MAGTQWEVHSDPDALAEAAARRVAAAAGAAIGERGRFTLTLAGGSTPARLYRLLAASPYREQIDWSRVFVFFGDERCVPPDHPDSNYRMASECLLGAVPLPAGQVHRMPGEEPPEAGATAYAALLRSAFALSPTGRPRFDLVLLGMGDDGHTASLFPGTPALSERRRLVTATQAPDYVRPRAPRITLTLPVLNAAAAVLFLVAGKDKAPTVKQVLRPGKSAPPLPARLVHPRDGTVLWLLDAAAASLL